tara:strand:+ start:151 stop:954 length:804 start_codon:yes stop_codon:yes gene_type:complete
MNVTTGESLLKFGALLQLARDISVKPNICSKKLSNAIKKYGSTLIKTDEILLLVDNTFFGSAKQGLIITESNLYAFSRISGKFSIKLDEVLTINPHIKKAMGIPIAGITINSEYFISLPGLNEELNDGKGKLMAILLLSLFLVEVCGCQIISEEDEEIVKEKNVAKKVWQQDVIRKNNSNDDIRIFEQGKEYYQKIEHDIDNYQEQKRQIKPRIVTGGSATSTITTPKEIEKIKCCFCRRIGDECSDCGEIVCSWHMCSCEEECDDC